ncbi:MAG: dienelactone hydrolase family protein [Oleiphilaceae bacterium]|nr:dienelactone hydrolase family protein [Oleiphilaceae bacterium]
MKTIVPIASALALSLAPLAALAELQTDTIDYKVNGEDFTGYLTYDDEFEGKRPGVLVVHEWWGLDEFARQEAEKLAKAGYTAFALDMYGSGNRATHPDDAKKFMQATMGDKQALEARFRTAMDILKGHDTVESSKIAAQGYCFGGAVVLNMARMGLDLDGVVSFHGSLGSDVQAKKGDVSARILSYTGGADPFVPTDQVTGFVAEMVNAEADLTLVSFPGVKHSFMVPDADATGEKFDLPMGYDEAAAQRAWQGTQDFYQKIFAD